MKKLILVCGLLFSLLYVSANDTLTRAQIYSFNVGDTFEYRYSSENIDMGMPYTASYVRKVVMQKMFSTNLDAIYFGYGDPGGNISQWETITDLDSFPILQIPNIDASCIMIYSFDTTTYLGFVSNGLRINCFESGASYRYTKGLGCTLSSSGHVGNIGYGTVASTVELTYYSNGTTQFGTSHYNPSTDIQRAISLRNFSLSPNPAYTQLIISISEEHSGSTLTLTDLTGRLALKSEITNLKSEINIAELPSGIYLATLTTPNGQRAVRKVVKE